MPDPVLAVSGLDAFYGDFQALFGVSVAVQPGEVLAMIGANGAGKSTFLNAVAGLVPARRDAIRFRGEPIGGLGADRIWWTKLTVYVVAASATSMVGALIFLQKLRISPDAAFSVNDWTAYVIFIVVIGGIGTIEGPIIGVIVFFLLRETLADLGSIYLMILGAVAIVVMLKAPRGLWGFIRDRYDIELFPVRRCVRLGDGK